MSDDKAPKTAAQEIGEGIGCALAAVGVAAAFAIMQWAISGFPGLPR